MGANLSCPCETPANLDDQPIVGGDGTVAAPKTGYDKDSAAPRAGRSAATTKASSANSDPGITVWVLGGVSGNPKQCNSMRTCERLQMNTLEISNNEHAFLHCETVRGNMEQGGQLLEMAEGR